MISHVDKDWIQLYDKSTMNRIQYPISKQQI